MLANVDRLIVGENAGLECKTASAYSADKWKDGHIPESYEIQCHHYMAVTGADAWYIACVILGKEFIWHKIERDEEIIQMLIRLESDFGMIMFWPKRCRAGWKQGCQRSSGKILRIFGPGEICFPGWI